MLTLITSMIGILLTIFFVIVIHEFGHFLAARLAGVKVLRFSIGFGKKLLSWHDKKGTEYVIAAIPLGGYIKMLDETENEQPIKTEDLTSAYNRQPYYKKFFIVAAGPISNLIFAGFIYWTLFTIGFVSIVPLIGKISPNSPAAIAGMQPQQEIIRIDDHPTLSWISVIIRLITHVGDQDHIQITTKNPVTEKTHNYFIDTTNWHIDNLRPDPLSSLGLTPYEPEISLIIGKISPDSPAALSFKKYDKILAVNNQQMTNWHQLAKEIDSHPETILIFKIEREKKIITLPIKTSYQHDLLLKKHGVIGIGPDFHFPKNLLRKNQYKPLEAFSPAWQSIQDLLLLNYISFSKLITGKISLESLGGPITIFSSAGSSLNQGIVPFFGFLALLSVSIGFINILPIPGLDGGHILFQCIEIIIRRPIPMRWQILFYRFGMIALLLLITQAIVNDLLRL